MDKTESKKQWGGVTWDSTCGYNMYNVKRQETGRQTLSLGREKHLFVL